MHMTGELLCYVQNYKMEQEVHLVLIIWSSMCVQGYIISVVHFIEANLKCENFVLFTHKVYSVEERNIKKSLEINFYFNSVHMVYMVISFIFKYVFFLLVDLSAVSFCTVTQASFINKDHVRTWILFLLTMMTLISLLKLYQDFGGVYISFDIIKYRISVIDNLYTNCSNIFFFQ